MKRTNPGRLHKLSQAAGRRGQELGATHRWDSSEASQAAHKGAMARWKKQKK